MDIYRAWDRVAAIEETAWSADGRVEATVGPRGELRSLVLDPRIYRTGGADALAADIVAVVADAAARTRDRVFAVVSPMLPRGADAETADLAFDPLSVELTR